MRKALAIALLFLVGLATHAVGDALTGSWATDLCVDGTPSLTTFDSTLVVTYEVCGWSFSTRLGFGLDDGWRSAAFDIFGDLGAYSIDSDIAFNPGDSEFWYWMSSVDLEIAGVSFTLGYDLLMSHAQIWNPDTEQYDTVASTHSEWTFSASGTAGLCSLGVDAYFGEPVGHCFCFDSIYFNLTFPFLCDSTVYASTGFSTDGFEGLDFDLKGLYFTVLPWLTFDFGLSFTEGTEDGKSFSFIPAISLTDACIDDAGFIRLFYKLYEGNAEFDGLKVYGIDIYKAWNGIWFEDLTSFDPALNGSVTGKSGYWEAIGIGTVGDTCCGGGFLFEVWSYFAETNRLFDWGLTEIDLTFGIGSNFDVTAFLSIDPTGLLEFCLGFAVSW